MKRRSFFFLLAGAAGLPLVPKKETPKPDYVVGIDPGFRGGDTIVVGHYDPTKYGGTFEWRNIPHPTSHIPHPTAQLTNECLDKIYSRLCETGTKLS